MTALVFLLGIAAVYVAIPNGYYQLGPLTVYQWAFFATNLSALFWAFASRQKEAMLAAVVIWCGAMISRIQWEMVDPEYFGAVLDCFLAAYFILLGKRLWEFAIGGIFLLSVLTGVLTETGYITDMSRRPAMIIAWSHPDITAILGHMAAVLLGAASGDSGKRVRLVGESWQMGRSLASAGIAKFSAMVAR